MGFEPQLFWNFIFSNPHFSHTFFIHYLFRMKYLMTLTLCLSIANASHESKPEFKFKQGDRVEYRLRERDAFEKETERWVNATIQHTCDLTFTYDVEIEKNQKKTSFKYNVKEEELRKHVPETEEERADREKREKHKETDKGKISIKIFNALGKNGDFAKANSMIQKCADKLDEAEPLVKYLNTLCTQLTEGKGLSCGETFKRMWQTAEGQKLSKLKKEAQKLLGKVLDRKTQTFNMNHEYGKFLKGQISSYVKKGEVEGGALRTIIESCIKEVVELYERANKKLDIFQIEKLYFKDHREMEDMDAIIESATLKLVKESFGGGMWKTVKKWNWSAESPVKARYEELKRLPHNIITQIKLSRE